MTIPKFIQIHFIACWPGVLLNRDDAGLAKRLPFGNAVRTRVSSQCLKRHWRMADDERALNKIDNTAEAWRSKVAIERYVTKDFRTRFSHEAVEALEKIFIEKIYGGKAGDTKSRQALLLGRGELDYLRQNAERLLQQAENAKDATKAAEDWFKEEKANLAQLREQNALAAGLTSALFGRMVTSDPRANTDAAIHVAHAFTVHPEQPELDYFTVVDDLKSKADGDNAGSAGIFDTELTSGLYYGYVVVDVPLLVKNLTGCERADWAGDHDRELAAKVVENLIWLIAEISPGAKKGSTAPYTRAESVLIEVGNRQPRTLANAFRTPVSLKHKGDETLGRLTAHALQQYLADMDAMYGSGEQRWQAALPELRLDGIKQVSIPELAEWAGSVVRQARCP